MISNQTNTTPTNIIARLFSDDPDKILLKYVLSQAAREQNNRKLQDHLKKLKKFGGRLPKEPGHDEEYGYQEWERGESELRGF